MQVRGLCNAVRPPGKGAHTCKKKCLNFGIAQIMGDPSPNEIWAPKDHFSPGCSKNVNTVFVQ